MNNSRYNGTPMLSPIGRNGQRFEATSMTNLLTPTKSNKSLLSSTRITPLRSTPRYALSKPMESRSPLTSTHFNSNSTFYIPSKVNKSPQIEQPTRESTPTHQAKYGRPGLFPVVHFFQKKVPVITPKQNSCVIKLSSNGPGLFDDTLDTAYESQNIVNNTQAAAESSTRSVLDALKEISRKRIHGADNYDKDKDKSNEYSKRNREEDSSLSPKSGAASPQQAPKRICVVDPIYASNTSSFCLKNNKRKLYECWLPSNENKNKKVMSVETQTQTTSTTTTETKSVSVQDDVPATIETTEKSTSSTNNEAETKKDCANNETNDDSGETIASAQRAWDEKIYAIQKKNKLAIVLSRITGEEPKLIPVPRLWDKTPNDVTDSNQSSNIIKSVESSSGIVSSASSTGFNFMVNGESKPRNENNDKQEESSSSIVTTSTSGLNVSFVKTPAVTSTTTSGMAPISSSFSTLSGNAAVGKDTAKNPMSLATTLGVSSSIESFSSLPSSSSSAPTFNFSSPKSSVSAMSTMTTPLVKSTVTTASGNSFAFGSNLTAVTATTTNIASAKEDPPATGFKFGGDIPKAVVSTAASSSSGFGTAGSTSTIVSPFTLKPSITNVPSTSTEAFTAPTLKTSAFSTPVATSEKTTVSITSPNSSIAASNSSNPPIAFGATGKSLFGPGKVESVSFATAFGLNSTATGTATTNSAPKNITFDTGPTTTTTGGFSFKPSEEIKPAAGISSGNIFGSTGTTTTTSTSGFSASIFGGNANNADKPTSSAPSFGSSFGASSSAVTTASTGFGMLATPASLTASPATTVKPFASVFGTSAPSVTTAAPSFGSTPAASTTVPTFGGFTTTTQPAAFDSAASTTGQQPSAFGATTGTVQKSTFGSITGTTSSTGGKFSFGASNATNAPPPSYAASVATTAGGAFGSSTTSSTASGFGFGSTATTPAAGTSFGSTPAPSFGSTQPTFGSTSNAGATTAPTAFGAPTTTANAPVFGFGGNATSKPASTGFGATSSTGGFGFSSPSTAQPSATGSTFGQSGATSGPVFSFGQTSAPTTTNSFGFGAAAPATTTPAFGSSGFGASGNTFGSPATTQSSGFGSAPNVNPFGKSATSAFGAPSASSSTTTAFGAPASQPTPAFGASSPPANNSSFGFAFGQPATQTSNFNSSFGAAAPPAANNTSFAFGATSNTSGFGSVPNTQPAFGATPSSGFNFKSPTPAAEQKPVFAFGGPETKPAAGGFNFSGAAAAAVPTNFGAAFGASSPQQPGMFSIGSGASAPGKRPQLRGKRRT